MREVQREDYQYESTAPILVDVNNLVKYSVYHPRVGEVCWDVEVMKCYFLPLSPISFSPCSITEVALLSQQY